MLLHTCNNEMMGTLNNNYSETINEAYPLALMEIVNKPLLCYQLEYLERYGIHNILITIDRKYANRIEKYIKNHYKRVSDKLNIELVVFHEKEEDSMVALSLLQPKLNSDFIVM